jgi:hypothetical protein
MISIMVDSVTIHSKVNPKSEPAAIFDAQLPGSIKPTVTNKPGPMYLRIFRAPKVGLWFLLSIFLKNENIVRI